MGIPVICEKALATSVQEVAAINSQLHKGKGFLAVTYNYTGYPMLRELRQMVMKSVLDVYPDACRDVAGRICPGSKRWFPVCSRTGAFAMGRSDYIAHLGVHLHMMLRFLTNDIPSR